MEIQTTQLGGAIIEEAEKLLLSNCLEATNNNDGQCIRDIVAEYSNTYGDNKLSSGKSQPAYCAMTASVIIGRACLKIGIDNPLWSAGATDLLYKAKKLGITVDHNPAPGCLILKKASSPSGLHAGICWYVDTTNNDMVATIEGNTTGYLIDQSNNNCLYKAPKEGIVSRLHTKGDIDYYVHIETLSGADYSYTRELDHSGMTQEQNIGYLSDDIPTTIEGESCVYNWQPYQDDSPTEESPDDNPDIGITGTDPDAGTNMLFVILGIAVLGFIIYKIAA